MSIVEEKIVGYLQCAIGDIDAAMAQMHDSSDSTYYEKRKTRLLKAKIQLKKVLKKNYKGWM